MLQLLGENYSVQLKIEGKCLIKFPTSTNIQEYFAEEKVFTLECWSKNPPAARHSCLFSFYPCTINFHTLMQMLNLGPAEQNSRQDIFNWAE